RTAGMRRARHPRLEPLPHGERRPQVAPPESHRSRRRGPRPQPRRHAEGGGMRRQGRALHAAPGLARSGGYACAILYGTGITEVVAADDARAVIGALRTSARSLGVSLDDWWASVPHEEYAGNVRRLTAACRELGGTRTGAGRFSGVDFEA